MNAWPRPPELGDDVRAELEAVDEDTCWLLLGSAPIGRIAVPTADGTILVLPLNFTVQGSTIRFRTAPGAALAHLGRGRVTFEVDGVDQFHRTGWSVLAHGWPRVVAPSVDHDTEPVPWAGGHRRILVEIDVDAITGRVLRPAVRDFDARGYL